MEPSISFAEYLWGLAMLMLGGLALWFVVTMIREYVEHRQWMKDFDRMSRERERARK